MTTNSAGTNGLGLMQGAVDQVTAAIDARQAELARLRRLNREALLLMALRRIGPVIANDDLTRATLAEYLANALEDAP